MSYNSTVFSQILQRVNNNNFKNQVSKHNGDKGVSKFKCFQILAIMLFTQLKTMFSLRSICTGLNIYRKDYYHLGMKNIDKISRSSLADALKTRASTVFEDFFYHLLGIIQENKNMNYLKKLHCRKKHLKILDSTTIGLCKNRFNWAKFRKTKSGIKLHTVFDPKLLAPVKVFITNAKKHDINIVDKIDLCKDEMYVFDRGYNDYKYWYSIELAKAKFVTRLKSNASYRVIKINKCSKKNGVKKDRLIHIIGIKEKNYVGKLRLISYYDEDTKKYLEFITNDFKSSAKEVANIYKTRWMIELFFKWVKQHLSIKKFVSTTENGVKIQIWSALILYLLLLLIRNECIEELDLFELLRRVKEGLMLRIDVFILITNKFNRIIQKKVEKERFLW